LLFDETNSHFYDELKTILFFQSLFSMIYFYFYHTSISLLFQSKTGVIWNKLQTILNYKLKADDQVKSEGY
jgi:hypothetical protein